MKDKILFILYNGSTIASYFGSPTLKYDSKKTDLELHEWLVFQLKKEEYKNIEKIVIPIYLGSEDYDFTGLRIGMHIRLSEELGNKRYLPLIFLSEPSKEDILFEQVDDKKEKTATLLTTVNTKLVKMEVGAIQDAIDNFSEPLDEQKLKVEVLPKLIVENQRDSNHQLANEWGCFRLAKFEGLDLTETQKLPADLYFKYKYHLSGTNLKSTPIIPHDLSTKDCKALLIDDNANTGWRQIIEHTLKTQVTSGAIAVDTILSEADFNTKSEADLLQYDVVYLDLRLVKNENHAKISDFSGAKILKKIKAINRGVQVIVLTASNKAWNMEHLLSEGADGYYIKESPEMFVSDEFSKENYENLVETSKKCLNRGYLKESFTKHQIINNKIDSLLTLSSITTEKQEFLKEAKIYFNMSFELLYTASNETDNDNRKNKFGFAYLSLFKVVERINKYFKDASSLTSFPNYCFNESNLNDDPSSVGNYATGRNLNRDALKEFPTLSWICIDLLSLSSHDLIRRIYWAIKRRNKFIHADSSIEGEQKRECRRIDNEDGYTDFLNILEKIILQIP